MSGYRNFRDFGWVLIILLFLYPVVRFSSHGGVSHEALQQGPLLTGRGSLDSLIQDARGRPVIVNFWATWCTPCVSELPHIDEVYRSSNGEVRALAVDIGDPRLETLLDFRESFNLSMPVIWLSTAEVENLKREWDLPDLLPVSVILDSQGNETVRAAGTRDAEFFSCAVRGEEVQQPDTVCGDDLHLHINVVGAPSDPMTALLMQQAVELGGVDAVDRFDPTERADSLSMEENHLPFTGFPYAQPCIGSACGRLARTPEDLVLVVESLLD